MSVAWQTVTAFGIMLAGVVVDWRRGRWRWSPGDWRPVRVEYREKIVEKVVERIVEKPYPVLANRLSLAQMQEAVVIYCIQQLGGQVEVPAAFFYGQYREWRLVQVSTAQGMQLRVEQVRERD